jgi:N-acetylglutamate synthase-like GNAT family acetyltransferase
MDLTFAEATEKDIPELTKVMTRAFDDDAQKHLGVEKGGPPGYDNGEFFRKWLLPYKESVGYKIVSDEKVIGGIIVWILETKENFLGTIFIDPDYQDQGVGTRTWQFIEETYPGTKQWTLETPSWAVKNHHFYEQKCGFKKIEEKVAESSDHPGTSYVYQKVMEDR